MFKPGQSGNPGGRPKREGRIREIAQQYGEAAIQRLVELMHSEDERVAMAAAIALLDRGYGKAPQATVAAGAADTPIIIVETGVPRTLAEAEYIRRLNERGNVGNEAAALLPEKR